MNLFSTLNLQTGFPKNPLTNQCNQSILITDSRQIERYEAERMILKIGRDSNSKIACGKDDYIPHNFTWEYTERVTNAFSHDYDTPTPEQAMERLTDITYITETDRWEVVQGESHITTLSGADVCYLMNDNGKTIERLR